MPQTVTPRLHRTITLAANDLCTVNYTGRSHGSLALKNNGPGSVWVSFDATAPAAVGDVNCFVLLKNEVFFTNQMDLSSVFTLNADTAATIVTLSYL
jgi:hypothetical protein